MNGEILIGGLLVVAVAVAVAVVAGLAVQRWVPVADRQENNDVAGIAFAIIGVLYAILMTFVIVSVWEAGDAAQDSSRAEARAIVDLDRYAETLPAGQTAALKAQTAKYVQIVERQEWPAMARGEPVGRAGSGVIAQLWRAVDQPVGSPSGAGDDAAVARQAEARNTLRELVVSRDARLAAADAGLPRVMWLALIVGDVLTLANALMFGVKGSGEYLAIVAMLSAMSALMLFAVYELEFPFQRGESVTVEVFSSVVDDGAAS
ncbi:MULTISPECIES: DUF4239 domain-containing protein [Dactylosporangium]|uniref:DUF4239 domain-containing protein n=2 Tax=Dactylosporangium TaxID=35753 RepID=A0A9W6KQS8_9ACTN|nr:MULTISPECIES: DUF4239 domain-containing protein [Dactylosporangium]UAB93586.1 DUF4239 domain-containing protein [Dactylosporangium vinaceum]UWZ41972.1 DUF4239 domain-containing protein [Dactylosporangium matsuzakiense]GLL04954.1 hypothetical protein GCM10017581_067010 [Dactylosporangium matsuzakiense]